MKSILQTITRTVLVTLALVGLVGVVPLTASSTAYADNADTVKSGVKSIGGDENGNKAGDFNKIIKNVINILLFLIGAIAVIVIIISGIRFTTSGGDAGQAKSAREGIIYAVVGLVVALLAFALVNFVIDSLK